MITNPPNEMARKAILIDDLLGSLGKRLPMMDMSKNVKVVGMENSGGPIPV